MLYLSILLISRNEIKIHCYGGYVTIVCIGLSKGERLFVTIVQDFILHPFVLHCRTGPEELNQEPQTSPIILLSGMLPPLESRNVSNRVYLARWQPKSD